MLIYLLVATHLQQNLTKILSKPRRFSKKVIFDASPSEFSSMYLTNSFGSTQVIEDVKRCLQKSYTVFEVGSGEVTSLLKKGLLNTDEKFFVTTKIGLNGFLGSLGR